jgi:hypothetical protein
MKGKWIGITGVIAVVLVIGIAKIHQKHFQSSDSTAQVVMVSEPSDAASAATCGKIVRAVRSAVQRGIRVQDLTPDSKSDLIARYRVFKTPTVLFLEQNGNVRARYEGEGTDTLAAIQSELGRIQP